MPWMSQPHKREILYQSESMSQTNSQIKKYHMTEVTIQHLNWNTVHFNTSTYFTNKISKYNNQIDLE